MRTQPKALYLLNFVSMWECFSYYGMRILLVLFMTHELRFSDSEAFGLYALYTTLVEFGGLFGGIAADRFLGLKRAIQLGGLTIALGHLALAVPDSPPLFFLGLGLIIAGTGLFRSNAAALLGECYEENDPRREAGYTLYYAGINIGGFLATLCCGYVGEVYGWHAGFSLAACGMLAGNGALWWGRKLLAGKGEKLGSPLKMNVLGIAALILAAPLAAWALQAHETMTTVFPLAAAGGILYLAFQMRECTPQEKREIAKLAVFILFLALFYACEEQLGSSLILFAERHVDRETLYGVIPAASLTMVNPLTILIAGPLFSKLLQKRALSGQSKIGTSFLLLGAAFAALYAGCCYAMAGGFAPIQYALGSIFLIALGEIFIGPTVYAAASKAAPRSLQGIVMGMVTMGFSLANLLSGTLSQGMAITEETASLEVYQSGFLFIAAAALGIGALLICTNFRKKEKAIA